MPDVNRQQYDVHSTDEGFVFVFHCFLCHQSVTNGPIRAGSAKEAVKEAWLAAAKQFNKCRICGKWVCDLHYNEDEMTCVKCIPKKIYCKNCGNEIEIGDVFCRECGNAI